MSLSVNLEPLNKIRKAVVTGATGFIGTHLVRRLGLRGIAVTGLSRSGGFDILTHDLPLEGADHVFHLAGLTFVPKAWDDPVTFHLINAHGTVRVLDQCRRAGVPVTYASAYVYGVPQILPISEIAPTSANNPYTFSKLSGEHACRFFVEMFEARIGMLRIFNVYGPDQDPSFLVPKIVRQVTDPGVAEIVVADLAPRRDYVFIDDVVDAFLMSPALPPGLPFNVGSGVSRSVEDVISACLSAAGVSKPFRACGRVRANELPDVVADISAIEKAVGWHPTVDFERGIATVIESARS